MRKELNEKLFGRGLIDVRDPTGSITEAKFTMPPYSILDARMGKWRKRKNAWIDLGIQGELGRQPNEDSEKTGISYRRVLDGFGGGIKKYYDKKNAYAEQGMEMPEQTIDEFVKDQPEKKNTGTSVFDPVLTELMYKWFCPQGGRILDPFAGGSTRGIVAEVLGYDYTGVECRGDQVRSNVSQADALEIAPNWIHGDSTVLGSLLDNHDDYDLIFTCPPYYDLEFYSGGDGDGSMHDTYEEFIDWYQMVFAQAVAKLKENRFLVVVVGEARDRKTGAMYGFVPDNFNVFNELGLVYYNEMILATSVGSLIMRAGKIFDQVRKIGKQHQNVLVFYKGNPRGIDVGVDIENMFNLRSWRDDE